MNILILKKYLETELVNYNYVLGSRLLIYYVDVLIKKYLDEFDLLNEFKMFLQTADVEKISKEIKNKFNQINNPKIIIDLLRFFNPTVYGYFTYDITTASNAIEI